MGAIENSKENETCKDIHRNKIIIHLKIAFWLKPGGRTLFETALKVKDNYLFQFKRFIE